MKEDIEDIKAEQEGLERDIAAMQSGQAIQYLKDMVKYWKEDQKQQQSAFMLDDLLDIMFSSEGGGW